MAKKSHLKWTPVARLRRAQVEIVRVVVEDWGPAPTKAALARLRYAVKEIAETDQIFADLAAGQSQYEEGHKDAREEIFGGPTDGKGSVPDVAAIVLALQPMGHVKLIDLVAALEDLARVGQPVVVGDLWIEKVR